MPETFLYAACLSAYAAPFPITGIVQQIYGAEEEDNGSIDSFPEEVFDGQLHRDKFY